MKKIFIFLLLLQSFFCFAQGYKFNEDKSVYYGDVILLEGRSKSEIYAIYKLWYDQNFKSSKDALNTDDKELGILSANGYFFTRTDFAKLDVYFKVTVLIKDGKIKYTIENIDIGKVIYFDRYFNENGEPKRMYKNYVKVIDERFREFEQSILDAYQEYNKKNDW